MAITFPIMNSTSIAAKITTTSARSDLLSTTAIIESSRQTTAKTNPAIGSAYMSDGKRWFDRPDLEARREQLALDESIREELRSSIEPRTLDDDPAFMRLLESLDARSVSAEAESRRSFRISLISICIAAASFIVALVSFLLR